MPLSVEEQRVRYLELQKILGRRHGRPFTYDETVEIGRGLVKLVTVLATIQHRLRQEQDFKRVDKDDNL